MSIYAFCHPILRILTKQPTRSEGEQIKFCRFWLMLREMGCRCWEKHTRFSVTHSKEMPMTGLGNRVYPRASSPPFCCHFFLQAIIWKMFWVERLSIICYLNGSFDMGSRSVMESNFDFCVISQCESKYTSSAVAGEKLKSRDLKWKLRKSMFCL